DRAYAANEDAHAVAGLVAGVHDVHARHAALDRLERVRRRELGDLRRLHRRHRAGHRAPLLRAVADDHRPLELDRFDAQPEVGDHALPGHHAHDLCGNTVADHPATTVCVPGGTPEST